MMAKHKTLWNIILVISVLMILHGMSNQGDSDKKTAQAAQGETAVGAAGVAAFVMKKQIYGVLGTFAGTGLFALIGGILLLGPFILGQWKNLFFPPAIPTWVYFAGFGLIFLMLMMNKRR